MSTARRPLSFVLSVVAASLLLGSVPSHAGTHTVHQTVSVAVAATDAGDDSTTTTIVASEGPVPGIDPRGIPLPTGEASEWWEGKSLLLAFGGLQLVGLFFITRRARARLSTDDSQP
jgi:hypothetical protein